MRDISLHILDLAQNCIKAGASLVEISFEYLADGKLQILLKDNGCGMPPDMLANVKSPFVTSRTTRKVGLGISLWTQNAEASGGWVEIQSEVGKGTEILACFDTNNIDCLPLGDIIGSFLTLLIANPDTPDFVFSVRNANASAVFDTREIRAVLGEVPLSEPSVVAWMEDSLQSELTPVFGG